VLSSALPAINRAFDYALSQGIKKIGMSISDPAVFDNCIDRPNVSSVQIQHNLLHPYSTEKLERAVARGVEVVTNRPLAMGALASDEDEAKIAAFAFIKQTLPIGIVLTGTKSPAHLRENVELFAAADKLLRK
jgi:aryl-alcohol dehydrogenase-like predicted oxidoreductase